MLKLALELASVVTVVELRRVCPSPLPESSQFTLRKNSRLKVVLVCVRSPPGVVLPSWCQGDKGKFADVRPYVGSFVVVVCRTPWVQVNAHAALEWRQVPRSCGGRIR